MISKLLKPKEVSEILGITVETMAVWRSVGRHGLPFVRVGGKIMYRPEDIQAFIESRTMKHTA